MSVSDEKIGNENRNGKKASPAKAGPERQDPPDVSRPGDFPPEEAPEVEATGVERLAGLAARGALPRRLRQYLDACRAEDRFPNVAGFCRAQRVGVTAFEGLRKLWPEVYDALCAALEDEVLNRYASATLIGQYLKRRLGYDEKPDAGGTPVNTGGEVQLIFEHDILHDGE